ncbi:MAG: translational GTPase TypA, partial [Actinomycetota bacterium]|nr:translational GTPase TypA [Actinomycetota bacterium]
HLTNHRSATGDELVRMNRARKMSLDEALEFIREDECVEVTPRTVRLRKVVLEQSERVRATRRGARTQTA